MIRGLRPLARGSQPKMTWTISKNRWKSPSPSGSFSPKGLGSWIQVADRIGHVLNTLDPALQVEMIRSGSGVINFGDFRLGEILAIRPLVKGLRPFHKGVTRTGVTHTTPG